MTNTLDESVLKDARVRLLAGRVHAIDKKAPYFRAGLMAIKPVAVSPDAGLPTAGVDKRWRMYYNPVFIASLDLEELAGLWLHELGHLLREHGQRWGVIGDSDRFHNLWNMAGDAAINADLKDCSVTLPRVKAIFPERIHGAERKSTTEQMYRLLRNGPEGQKVVRTMPELVVFPNTVARDYPDNFTMRASARDTITGTTVTVRILTPGQTPKEVTGAVAATTLVSDHLFTFDLTAGIAAGTYMVEADIDGNTVHATFSIVDPSITVRPNHVERGYTAPFNTVIEGSLTRFAHDGLAVTILAADGNEVADAAQDVTVLSDGVARFNLSALPDGTYIVKAVSGTDTMTAPLPVGLPFLDLTPDALPVGYPTPYPVAGMASDIVFDTSSEYTLVQVTESGLVEVPATAITGFTVATDTSIEFYLAESLPEGQYLLGVTGQDGERAVATFTVSDGGNSGAGQGDGDGEEDSDSDSDSDPGNDSGSDGSVGSDCGSGAGGGKRPWEKGDSDNDDGSIDEGRAISIRQQVAQDIKEAATNSRGTVPGGLVRWADTLLDPRVSWDKELAAVARRTVATVAGRKDYSYSRPGRRAAVMGNIVVPAMRQPGPPAVDVVIDTSGSMGTERLTRAVSEISAIVERVSRRGSRLRVWCCDADVAEAQNLRNIGNISLTGGGGTDMRVGIKAAAEARPKSDLVIVLSDGGTPWPDAPDPANLGARYVAVLVDGECDYSEVPDFMHKITIDND